MGAGLLEMQANGVRHYFLCIVTDIIAGSKIVTVFKISITNVKIMSAAIEQNYSSARTNDGLRSQLKALA